jgi:transcriptional regulator with XRE-family HTH domain
MPAPKAKTGQFENLGRALGLLRELRGLSQAALARRAGVGKSQISKYEGGRELPKLGSLERLLEILDVRQDAFFSIIAMLDGLHEHVSAKPGAPLVTLTVVPSLRSVSPLDEAFAAAFQTLLALHRSVLEILVNGVVPAGSTIQTLDIPRCADCLRAASEKRRSNGG